MVSWIVRRIIESGYRKQNRGDYGAVANMFAADGRFEFEGETPFGGERRGRDEIQAWFELVAREFGRLNLNARDVTVAGPPWNLRVIVRFSDRYELITGETMSNHGYQFLRIAWGKVKEDRILVDLDVVHQALARIATQRQAVPRREQSGEA